VLYGTRQHVEPHTTSLGNRFESHNVPDSGYLWSSSRGCSSVGFLERLPGRPDSVNERAGQPAELGGERQELEPVTSGSWESASSSTMPDNPVPPSTEAQRRTERLGYVAPCRCAMTHEASGHTHACIAGQGHAGWHRCYCGQWFAEPDSPA
jgi:hypothetical protein